jgi:hypothetical protein
VRVRFWYGLIAIAACVHGPHVEPRAPGDHCNYTCPDGMHCWGTTRYRSGKVEHLGRCGLEPGRCATDVDCARGEQCVRPLERFGLCAPSPRP